MHATQLPSLITMTGRAACWKFGRTALLDLPAADLEVVADLEVAEAVEVWVPEGGMVVAVVPLVAVTEAGEATAGVTVGVPATTPAPLPTPLLLLRTLSPTSRRLEANGVKPSMFGMYAFLVFRLGERHVADECSCHGPRVTKISLSFSPRLEKSNGPRFNMNLMAGPGGPGSCNLTPLKTPRLPLVGDVAPVRGEMLANPHSQIHRLSVRRTSTRPHICEIHKRERRRCHGRRRSH